VSGTDWTIVTRSNPVVGDGGGRGSVRGLADLQLARILRPQLARILREPVSNCSPQRSNGSLLSVVGGGIWLTAPVIRAAGTSKHCIRVGTGESDTRIE